MYPLARSSPRAEAVRSASSIDKIAKYHIVNKGYVSLGWILHVRPKQFDSRCEDKEQSMTVSMMDSQPRLPRSSSKAYGIS